MAAKVLCIQAIESPLGFSIAAAACWSLWLKLLAIDGRS
jgi:hypothetical protein